MAKFPNDVQSNHISTVVVPNDRKRYAVKDTYARSLCNFLNTRKSEVYIGTPSASGAVSPSAPRYTDCYLDPHMFSPVYDAQNKLTSKVLINSHVVYVNLDNSSPIGSHTINMSDKEWESLVNGVDHHVSPIHINFTTNIHNSNPPSGPPIASINSDIIMASTQVVTDVSTGGTTEWFFTGTGLIYTGTDIDAYKYVLVRMKLHGVAGSRQAVITVTELPKMA